MSCVYTFKTTVVSVDVIQCHYKNYLQRAYYKLNDFRDSR